MTINEPFLDSFGQNAQNQDKSCLFAHYFCALASILSGASHLGALFVRNNETRVSLSGLLLEFLCHLEALFVRNSDNDFVTREFYCESIGHSSISKILQT